VALADQQTHQQLFSPDDISLQKGGRHMKKTLKVLNKTLLLVLLIILALKR